MRSGLLPVDSFVSCLVSEIALMFCRSSGTGVQSQRWDDYKLVAFRLLRFMFDVGDWYEIFS